VRQASNEWLLISVDVPSPMEDALKCKLVSANRKRHCFAITDADELYYWQSYWDRDPNYPALL
jgi:hypothetical protein